MFVLRLVAVLSLLATAIAFGLFLATRNRRYLKWGWRILQFAFVFAIAVMVLYVLGASLSRSSAARFCRRGG